MTYYEHKLDPVGQRPDWLADDDIMLFSTSADCGFHMDMPVVVGGNFKWAWEAITAIRIKSDHWAVPALKAGGVPVRKPALTDVLPTELVEQMQDFIARAADTKVLPEAWSVDAKILNTRIGMALNPDPVRAALQDKWPMLDTEALRAELAKHNLKIVESSQ